MSEHLLLRGDARRIPIADKSVHCVVTSPPYFGLRDYGTATWEGGSEDCEHVKPADSLGGMNGKQPTNAGSCTVQYRDICGKCGARRVDRQIGLEPTPDEFVAAMVAVFGEVRRVLRDDGTCWLNLGDSYNAYNGGAGPSSSLSRGAQTSERPKLESGFGLRFKGLKPKDLIGIPWRVALALQADGWWLRSDIIWHKPNPMPESVTDRPTKSHEYLFLLAKQERYYFDGEAVREGLSEKTVVTYPTPDKASAAGITRNGKNHSTLRLQPDAGRNIRSVWTIPTHPYKGAHFATYPTKLVVPCIKAGTSERGCCPECGAPWVRMRLKTRVATRPGNDTKIEGREALEIGNRDPLRHVTTSKTIGWRPSCGRECGRLDCGPVPCVVLDPFNGSGTTGQVATSLGRNYLGLDLSAEYLSQARERIATPLQPPKKKSLPKPKPAPVAVEYMPLFDLL